MEKTIVILIANVRKDKGKSQSDVATATGIAERQLSRYENQHEVPKLPTLAKIADYLGCTIEDLYEVKQV